MNSTKQAGPWAFSAHGWRRISQDGFPIAIVEPDTRNENLWLWSAGSTTDRKAYRNERVAMQKADAHLQSVGYALAASVIEVRHG